MPGRTSMRARISKRPYCQLASPRVVRLADVYAAYRRRARQSSIVESKAGLRIRSRLASMMR